jgi:PAS domain S-box-containing protein
MRDGPQHFTVESEVESLRRRNRALEERLAQQTRALERRVQERTAQLSHVVEALRAEVAERERMEEELRRSKEQYHMLAANFPNGAVMMLDRDLRYVLAEGAGLEAVGISKELLIGKTIWEALPLETAAALEPHYRAALAGTAAVFEAPCSGHTYLVHAVPLRNDEGEICGAMAMTQDITAQKRAEAAQRSQRDFISAVIETAAALVVVLDREAHVVQFNRACQETSGYSFDEVKGKSAWEIPLVLPEETIELRAVFSRLAAGQFPNRHENHWVTKDGRRRLIAWTNTALLGPDGSVEHVIATGIDITERRRAEERAQGPHASANRRRRPRATGADGHEHSFAAGRSGDARRQHSRSRLLQRAGTAAQRRRFGNQGGFRLGIRTPRKGDCAHRQRLPRRLRAALQ